jgi:hypothetical protein
LCPPSVLSVYFIHERIPLFSSFYYPYSFQLNEYICTSLLKDFSTSFSFQFLSLTFTTVIHTHTYIHTLCLSSYILVISISPYITSLFTHS